MAPQNTSVGNLIVAVERPAATTHKPPVLLVHGYYGGAWYWEGYQKLLASRGYASHAINLRGHHGSRPVADIGKVPLRDYVDDAIEVARALGNPIVIGHSMGGLIAQKVAESGACRAAVFLSAAPPRWIPIVSWKLLTLQLKYTLALARFGRIDPNRSDADTLMFNRTPMAERAAFFPRLVPESGRAGFDMSLGIVAVSERRVTCPTLVITGSDDLFIVPRIARAIAAKYRSPIKTYDGFGHLIVTEPGWERPANDIIDWMDQH